jgi:hypothetical protein
MRSLVTRTQVDSFGYVCITCKLTTPLLRLLTSPYGRVFNMTSGEKDPSLTKVLDTRQSSRFIGIERI